MSSNISKANSEGTTPRDRLAQIRMGAYDRIVAEAHLARGEAIAGFLIGVVSFVSRGLRALVVRPFQRLTAAFS